MNFRNFIKKNQLEVIIVIALFSLALGIRAMPAGKMTEIYGFDSYWSARHTRYLMERGYIYPMNDTVTDHPYGRPDTRPSEIGWWFLNAAVYKITGGSADFDFAHFAKVASWMTAIAGALGVAGIYLFGRVACNRFAGFAAGLLLLANGNHLFYSIYGHAENDALGLALFFFGLFAFISTVKTRSWKLGLLTTFTFSYLSMTWVSYNVLVLLLSATLVVYFIATAFTKAIRYYKESPERIQTRKWMIYAMIFALPSLIFPRFVALNYWDKVALPAFGMAILLCSLIEYFTSGKEHKFPGFAKFREANFSYQGMCVGAALLLIGAAYLGTGIVSEPLAFLGMDIRPPVSIPDYQARLWQTIAEQNPIPGATFLDRLVYLSYGFGTIMWLALAGLVFVFAKIFIMPFVRKDFRYEWDILVLIFLVFTLWALTSKAQTMFFLAAAVVFGAAYFLGQLAVTIDFFAGLLKELAGILKFILLFAILLISFGYIVGIVPNAEQYGRAMPIEWMETFDFINRELPPGSVVTAWWDYGHWLAYYNGDKIKVTIDNIQDRPDLIYTVASGFTHTSSPNCTVISASPSCPSDADSLERGEIEALSILKPLKTTHILVDKEIIGGMTGGKFSALEHIAANQVGCMQTLICNPGEGGEINCPVGTDAQGKPVGLTFTQQDWSMLLGIEWPGLSLAEHGIPARVFAKEDSGARQLYMSAVSCGQQLILNQNSPVLYSFIQRLFFKDPNLKHVRLVFDNSWNVMYEVDWSGIPDPVSSILP